MHIIIWLFTIFMEYILKLFSFVITQKALPILTSFYSKLMTSWPPNTICTTQAFKLNFCKTRKLNAHDTS